MQSIGGCASFIFVNLFRRKSLPEKEAKDVNARERKGEPSRSGGGQPPVEVKSPRDESCRFGPEEFTKFVDGLPSISPTQTQSKQRLDGVYLPTETPRTPTPFPLTPLYAGQYDRERGSLAGEGETSRRMTRDRSSIHSISGLFGSYCRVTGKDGELSRIPLFSPEPGQTEGESGERQVEQ